MNVSKSSKSNEPSFLYIENLSKGYQEAGKTRLVLNQLTFSMQKGEFVAILGKSGSGKTTLLNLISGIDKPDLGQICLDGMDLTILKEQERTLFRRRKIGFIFQFFNLIPTLTVWENVLLPLELNGLADKENILYASFLLEEVELGDRKDTYPDRLSGGEQQRVAIARALVHSPQLILADEPTGNLDEERGLLIMRLLDRLSRQAGRNLLLVTHSIEAAQFSDRRFDLHDGKLILRE